MCELFSEIIYIVAFGLWKKKQLHLKNYNFSMLEIVGQSLHLN